MRESKIEAYLVSEVEKHGGTAEKFTSPARRSVPDRLCTVRPGKIFFVECKATGKKATAAQKRDHKRRRARGFPTYVVDSYAEIDWVLEQERSR